ncbi:MAG: hypothetical protein IJ083_06470 [Clostridia bacterium]|nr:hypothetical protein [Clostridia bacterium]
MRTRFFLIALMILTLIVPVSGLSEALSPSFEVTLPAGYETDGLNYPVLYVLPQDGFTPDTSDLAALLTEGMQAGKGTEMIIVRPAFTEGGDVAAEMQAVIQQVESTYRAIPSPAYRAAVGTGVGGYLAYALTLQEESPFQIAASIRGDFVSGENPWYSVCGDIQEKIVALHEKDENALNAYYTYMDAPVDDAWTDMKGSTDDLGALVITYGTGSAFHEFTVRPGTFTEDFLKESASRVLDRITARILQGIATGSLTLEKTSLLPTDETIRASYAINVSEGISAHAAGEMEMGVSVTVLDPAGSVLATAAQTHPFDGAGVIEGSVELPNSIATSSATALLSVHMLGTDIPAGTATIIVAQEPVVDGDFQQIELMGDWYFNYIGNVDPLDVSTLEKAEFETWSVVQPGLAWWTKGFGNISDETVVSAYGPDYFDYFVVGNAYYAREFTVPEDFTAQDLVLAVGYVDDRCEVFLNGVRVGGTGIDENGQPTGDTTWAVFSTFTVDPAVVNVGGVNTIVVRAYNDLPFGGGGWYSGPIGLYSKAAFDAQYAEELNPRFYEESYESAHVALANEQEGTMEEKYLVYLPEGYETSGRYYPTVYLLHQFNSDHTSYRTDHVDALLDEGIKAGLFDEMIVVIPNSSENSWWTGEWEKMITEELIPLIDSKYRTISDPRFRLAVGCSMGGQGAYAVALRNPDYFTGAVSFFGAFSYGGENSPNAIAAVESSEYLDSFALYFICGNQDSYGFGAPAIQLHQQLNALNVDHRFFIENGGHDSAFYVPFFQEGLAYARANMYKTDADLAGMIHGEAAVEGETLTATVTADEAIVSHLYVTPASSYTLERVPSLNLPLMVKVTQDGESAIVCTSRDTWITASELSGQIQVDLADKIDTSKAATVTIQAALFDTVIDLAEVEMPAR